MTSTEVTVRGAGIFGLSCAYVLARRGARVRVIDTRGIGAGSSGGLVGALAPHVPEQWNAKKAFQLESLLAAPAFWAEVAATGGKDPGYLRSGRLQPLADDAAVALAQDRAKQAETLWQGHAHWTVTSDAPPDWAPASPTGLWVMDTLTARLSPRSAGAALAAALQELGAEILIGEAPDRGLILHAAGAAGLAALSADLGSPIGTGIKGQSAAFACPQARDLPQLFIDGLHIVPHADGTVAIGSTSERSYTDPTSTDAQLDTLIARARAACPLLATAPVIDRWAGVRPRAITRAPILGPWPGRPGHYIANGGFKIGFGMAPGVARVMADLVLENRDTIPRDVHIDQVL